MADQAAGAGEEEEGGPRAAPPGPRQADRGHKEGAGHRAGEGRAGVSPGRGEDGRRGAGFIFGF